MKLTTVDGVELIEVNGIMRQGVNLALDIKAMGAMQMAVVLSPAEARQGLKLLNWRVFLFLISLPFRQLSGGR
jgi:hypothetical protein